MLHRREEGRKVVLYASEVHLVEAEKVGVGRVITGRKHEGEGLRHLVGVGNALKQIFEAEEARRIMREFLKQQAGIGDS